MKTVIIIAGPTAVGKTSVAISVAKQLGTEIISADSRQCYKEMNIGVARPSEEELAEVKHHFIASHSVHQNVNAATFEQYALEKCKEIFSKYDVTVMVGGTGLYIKAFCDGLDEMPDIPIQVRNEINDQYRQHGLTWLQEQVQNLDEEFYLKADIQNPHRLIRALEVKKATGRSILDYRKGAKATRDFKIEKIALELPKELLHQNINNRVDHMMEIGLLEEVQSLLPYQQLNALQTVGYKELFTYFSGEITLSEAVEDIKKNTRQYAKRQMTWFRKDKEYQWLDPRDVDTICKLLINN
ncbi:tRNA (adenosine(37)-N6)-dimethylallyltransferase MiaA [Chitinophagaceae bacterium LB-8]|uniref:tRNA dimethylallyltransferase n=1 Tax=Paraflavisolibacter caeni TaxID=2982496 RepID=A0A9X2XNS0_9BACT|nr:tRNA (adenosine(37)-N6)-dimethylallyltransferase MiaA [Paraflavisolibacter caeni]MCU7548954.1 tRNA (adenosine(37)-N6)-dimethylallyltransferase MiaA [Paraflavisolibacter caeni]